jgi:curli biogenesis system outer membrane secretion channel CsgG
MKRSVILLAVALVVALAAGVTAPAQEQQPRKKRVAILDFDYGTVRTATAGLFGTDIDVGKGISDLIVKFLVNDGTYSVIERKMLDRILAEQNFSNSDRANPASAAQIGKILGVDAIIVGSITQFGHETKSQNIGGAGGGWGGFGLGGVGRRSSKAIVAIDARVIDIDTAEILAVADGKGESKRSSTSLLGGGFGRGGFGVGAVDFSTSDFKETILGEAVHAAVQDLTNDLVAANSKLQTRVVIVEGLVAHVDGETVVLNVGTRSGLKVGDQLSVERVTSEIKDPATGNVIRRLTSKVGVIEVIDADDGSSVCRTVMGSGFQVGDLAKTKTQ